MPENFQLRLGPVLGGIPNVVIKFDYSEFYCWDCGEYSRPSVEDVISKLIAQKNSSNKHMRCYGSDTTHAWSVRIHELDHTIILMAREHRAWPYTYKRYVQDPYTSAVAWLKKRLYTSLW